MGLFGVPSVFGHHIKGMIRLRPEKVWMCNVMLHVHTCCGRDTIIFHKMTAILCKILQPKCGSDILRGFVISTDRRDHKSPVTSENSEVSAHTVGRQKCE